MRPYCVPSFFTGQSTRRIKENTTVAYSEDGETVTWNETTPNNAVVTIVAYTEKWARKAAYNSEVLDDFAHGLQGKVWILAEKAPA